MIQGYSLDEETEAQWEISAEFGRQANNLSPEEKSFGQGWRPYFMGWSDLWMKSEYG
jgi:hypothetical protein